MFKLKELYEIQKDVNREVLKRTKWEPDHQDFAIAMFVEMFEFINTLPQWKWWRHSQKTDKERALDELADIIAFYLSFAMSKSKGNQERLEGHLDSMFKGVEEYIAEFNSDVKKMIMFWFREMVSGDSYPAKMMNRAIGVIMAATHATQEEIITAYLAKSKENIERQRRNY